MIFRLPPRSSWFEVHGKSRVAVYAKWGVDVSKLSFFVMGVRYAWGGVNPKHTYLFGP